MTRIVLIPAYQPDNRLPALTAALHEQGLSVIVVDDGSGREYEEFFRKTAVSAHVITCTENRGKGEALKTGLQYITHKFPAPYAVVTADADGQHTVYDILRVLEQARAYPDYLLLGSRKFDKDVPLRSRFGNTVTRLVFRLCSGISVYDTQTGLRGFSSQLTDKLLSVPGSRYEYEMNVLLEAARAGIPIREVWIETVYLEGNKSSHFNTVKDSWRIYREILTFSASSLLSFLTDYSLFCLLSSVTGMLVLSNILARICSGTVNYTLNKRLVFRAEGGAPSAVKYILLATGILVLNTLLLRGMAAGGVPVYLAKLLTEALLFTLSYLVQQQFVFRKQNKKEWKTI